MQAFGVIAHLVLAVVQVAAFVAGIAHWLDIHWLFAAAIGAIVFAFLGHMPLLVAVLGMVGAHGGWGWSWLASFALFFWALVLTFGIQLVLGVSSWRKRG